MNMKNENNNVVLDEVLSSEESRVNRFLLNYLSNNGALDSIINETRAQVLAVEKERLLNLVESSPNALEYASEELKNDIKKDKQENTIRKPIWSETELDKMLENLTWLCNLQMKD